MLTSFALAQPRPPPPGAAPPPPLASDQQAKFGIGLVYDLGIVPSELSIGWAGSAYVSVSGAVGFSCFGGRAIVVPPSDAVVLGGEYTECRDLSYRIDAGSRSAGFFFGYRNEVAKDQYAGAQLGIGYSGGAIRDIDASWEGMYIRPRGSVTMERGVLAFDVGPFIQLPILFTQRIDGDLVGPGMLTRVGFEISAYIGRFGR